jgi:tetratricopeptide (TPR) repeat protein
MFGQYWDMFWGKYHLRRGLRMLQGSKYKKAAYHFEKAILLLDSTESFFYYAVTLVSLHKHKEAIAYLERIVEKTDDNILVSTTLADCYLVVREWEKAEQLLRYLKGKYVNNIVIEQLYIISQDAILREKYAEGKECFYMALDLLDKRDMEQSFESIKRAIELDETNASYHFLAGVILMQDNQPKENLEAYFEQAVLLSPQNENFKRQLQYVKTRYTG